MLAVGLPALALLVVIGALAYAVEQSTWDVLLWPLFWSAVWAVPGVRLARGPQRAVELHRDDAPPAG